MSDPIEIELVDIDSITSSGAKFWGRVNVIELLEPDEDGYIYKDGDYGDEWGSDQLLVGDPVVSQSKEADHLYQSADADGDTSAKARLVFYTNKRVDLADYDDIEIRWAAYRDGYDGHALIASDTQIDEIDEYDARLLGSTDGTETETLDIRSLSDNYYIRINTSLHRIGTAWPGSNMTLSVYHIRLLKDEE